MEKLQKALRKARQDRAVGVPRATRDFAPQSSGAGRQSAFPEIWDQLTPMEPNESVLLSHRIMTLNPGPEANPLDVLRTKVWLQMRENGWSRLAITSPNKSCGKTTIACNLAVGFSRQAEIKSMLLDVDLRRPGVANLLGQTPAQDIGGLLRGEVAPEDQMMRLRSNVAISMARRPVNDPAQLLLSRKVASAFDTLQAQFEADLMLFDLPPMLVTDDTRAVLRNADCALIVARAEQTRMSQLDVCEREVSEYTNILGVVLNNCRHLPNEENYYSDYS